jgi:hypothetical protein
MLFVLAAVLVPVGPVQAAPKTDIIVFLNGDRLTGEIKGLERGQLELKTDSLGTVYIEWDKVASVETTQYLDIETSNGSRYFGKSPQGEAAGSMRLIVTGEPEGQVLRMADVVRIAPIDQGGLIKRLDGYVTAGFSYAQANNETDLNFSGGLSSRNEVRQWTLDGQTTINSRSDDRSTSQYDVTLASRRFLRERWFAQGFGTVQGNDELGLDIREVLGVGLGRFIVQTGHNEWSAVAGLAGLRENFQSEETQNSLEGVIGTEYSYFRYDTPKRSVDFGLVVFPSLTESGRVRAEAQLESRFEIVKDLFFEISSYGSYDSDADESALSNTDYGVVTSLGYSF